MHTIDILTNLKRIVYLLLIVTFILIVISPETGSGADQQLKPALIILGEDNQAPTLIQGLENHSQLPIYVTTLQTSLEGFLSTIDGDTYSSVVLLMNNASLLANGTSLEHLRPAVEQGLSLIVQSSQLSPSRN